jgi:hypothetical protein
MSPALRILGIAAFGLAVIIVIVALANGEWIVGMGAGIAWLVLIGFAARALAQRRV